MGATCAKVKLWVKLFFRPIHAVGIWGQGWGGEPGGGGEGCADFGHD